jgi:hypothetical protein
VHFFASLQGPEDHQTVAVSFPARHAVSTKDTQAPARGEVKNKFGNGAQMRVGYCQAILDQRELWRPDYGVY